MKPLSRVFVGTALVFAGLLPAQPPPALAQSSSTIGGARGVVRDKATKEPAAGATVVATSPALVGEQVVLTDENGQYFISALPPGVYTLTIEYLGQQFVRGDVLVQVGKEALVNVTVDSSTARGEVVVLHERYIPLLDHGSTKVGVTITDDYTRSVPTGGTFGAVLGAVQGSAADRYGTSISGATSVESVYIVEGINTSDTGFGGLSSNLPNEFVAETEVITGGYNAELGRSTGGVVNVVTKSGSNELRGSVFGTLRPSALISGAKVIEREGSSIDSKTDLDYAWDLGAEIGGPIIKDRLWFHVGFNPSVQQQTRTRLVQSEVDRDQDGIPDTDPDTGFSVREPVSRREVKAGLATYFYTAKINGAVTPNHQFQISAFGNPRTGQQPVGVVRNPAFQKLDLYDGAYDLAAKWTSKLDGGKTQIDAVLGFHRQISKQTPLAGQGVSIAGYQFTRSLYDFADLEGESAIARCNDGSPDDPYPLIQNCPVVNYSSQGLSYLESRTNDRTSAVLAVTQRVKAAGYHVFKAGLDADVATYDSKRGYPGGTFMSRRADSAAGAPGLWQIQQLMTVKRNLTPAELAAPGSVELMQGEILCSDSRAICELARDGISANTTDVSVAAFLQDSWQIRPNLTLNAGLRWEQQTGYAAEALQGRITPQGDRIPSKAFELSNLLAPRLGFIYDPSQEGKSKVFGHWGRFYENVPMDINVRAFGGEITNIQLVNANRRTPEAQGYDPNCNVNYMPGGGDLSQILLQCQDRVQQLILGDSPSFLSPGLKGQYTDELILGTELQVVSDFKVGVSWTHRTLPRVIEDLSTDGGQSYVITNPGEDFSGEAKKLRDKAVILSGSGSADDEALAALLLQRADQLDGVSKFEKPVRNYDAVVLSAVQRPTRRSLLQASYTYSVSKGNFPGLYSTETDQLDPNLTSLYDLPDLMANRYGTLGLDRTHNLKIDGFYQFDLKRAGVLTTGASFRALSGIAHNVLGAHPYYGSGEAFLLPRGVLARSPVTAQLDLQVGYGRRLSKATTFEGFVRVFNIFDQQDELDIDENYTFDNVLPVIGGRMSDLTHVKALDQNGAEVNATVTPNKNFGKVSARQLPRTVQLGMRLTF